MAKVILNNKITIQIQIEYLLYKKKKKKKKKEKNEEMVWKINKEDVI